MRAQRYVQIVWLLTRSRHHNVQTVCGFFFLRAVFFSPLVSFRSVFTLSLKISLFLSHSKWLFFFCPFVSTFASIGNTTEECDERTYNTTHVYGLCVCVYKSAHARAALSRAGKERNERVGSYAVFFIGYWWYVREQVVPQS